MPEIALIAAMAHRRIIGMNGVMPWHIPDELARFKAATLGGTVIVGHTTYLGLPRRGANAPLPGRRLIVLSRHARALPDGVILARDVDHALDQAGPVDRVWVAGGANVYAAFLPRADLLRLTEIDADYVGDTAFPAIPEEDWSTVDESHIPGSPPYTIRVYRRITLHEMPIRP